MTGQEYQQMANRTVNHKLTRIEMTLHALFGIAGEVGELHSLHQKVYQGHEFDPEHAKKELGDLMWFIAEYCTANRWELEEVMTMNIEKLKKRYPNGFDEEHSLNRKEGDI